MRIGKNGKEIRSRFVHYYQGGIIQPRLNIRKKVGYMEISRMLEGILYEQFSPKMFHELISNTIPMMAQNSVIPVRPMKNSISRYISKNNSLSLRRHFTQEKPIDI